MRRSLVICDVCKRTEDSHNAVLPPGFVVVAIMRSSGQTQADVCSECWSKALFGMTAKEVDFKLVPDE